MQLASVYLAIKSHVSDLSGSCASLAIKHTIFAQGTPEGEETRMDRRSALLAFASLLVPGGASALGRPPPGPTGGWHFPPPPRRQTHRTMIPGAMAAVPIRAE